MSAIQDDFDRIALVSTDGATCNDHYHNFLLRNLPSGCDRSLDIGCGGGSFSRRLAKVSQHVIAVDLSPEMIRFARSSSTSFPNVEFHLGDIRELPLEAESFQCVASIATLHHLPYREILLKMRSALKPGGVLLVLDLFQPSGISDVLTNLVAFPVSIGLRLIHHGRLLRPREEREAWTTHEQHDSYLTMNEARKLCDEILPGAIVRKHLLWRYSIVWKKPE